MTAEFDLTGLDNLAADLAATGVEVLPFTQKALHVTANNIKKSWQGKVRGARALPGLANAITYDVTVHVADVEAEIGYDKSRPQGPLGNISEFGTPKVPGRGYGAAALHENEEDFVRGIDAAVADVLRARNL